MHRGRKQRKAFKRGLWLDNKIERLIPGPCKSETSQTPPAVCFAAWLYDAVLSLRWTYHLTVSVTISS